MRDTAGEVRTNSLVTYFCGPLHMDEQRQDDLYTIALCRYRILTEDLSEAMDDRDG